MVTLADQGRGPGSPLFLDQTEARRAEKNFGETGPPLHYLKFWIWQWVTPKDLIHLSER